MKDPPSFCSGTDNNTISSFVHIVGMYFGLTSIINQQTRHTFASLLLFEDAENWYNMRNHTSNATWETLKSDLLPWFKPVD